MKPSLIPAWALTATGALWFAVGCSAPTSEESGESAPPTLETVYLDQGWSRGQAQDFYYTTQGSQLIPYDWFLALDEAGRDRRLRDDSNMERWGFITQSADPQKNPDGLPIGFVKDDDPQTVRVSTAVRKALLGSEYSGQDFPLENSWLGMTCAACHTGEIRYGTHSILVDGAPAMIDYQTFAEDLVAALAETATDDNRFTSFAHRVLAPNYNDGEASALRRRLRSFVEVMVEIERRTTGPERYGFARLDAFGAILNAVCDTGLGIPGNFAKANAPVSFPFLWNAPHLDWVQWNGSIANPLARNVGEVLGVFAHTQLTSNPADGQFSSTAHPSNLGRLEQLAAQLQAPAWPEDILGEIDEAKLPLGRELFAENCSACHSVRDAEGRFPMTAPNKFGKSFIKVRMVAVEKIRTDPTLLENLGRLADPGDLRPFLPEQLKDAPRVPAPLLLKIADEGVITRWIAAQSPPLDPEQLLMLTGYRDPEQAAPNPKAYKARPLDGIWATAPFLHNGSVPNLYQLLMPSDQRTSFRLGSRKFDPKAVGFVTGAAGGSFEFLTQDADGDAIVGNANTGHEGPLYTQRKLEDGSFRDFTDDERWALVEYMKTLR